MSCLKRAKTWEVSDSEGDEVKDTEHTACASSLVKDAINVAITEDKSNVCDTTTRVPTPESSRPHTENATGGLVLPTASTTRSPSPGRKRRTPAEIEAERAKAEERKAARDRLRLERERVKEEKRHEQQRRKEDAEKVKSLKPENCLRRSTVRIHPVLLQEPGCDVLVACLAGLEWTSCIAHHELSHSISWTRQLPQGDTVVEEDWVLMVVSREEFIAMVTSIKQVLIGEHEGLESLFQPLSEYLKRNRGTVISLLVTVGLRDQRGGSWHDEDDGGLCPHYQLGLPDIHVEEVLVYLQLFKNVSVHFLFGWQEVTDHVCAVTKALSKRPFKAAREASTLGFCVEGSWAGGVRVDRDGTGLSQVWTRQIQQFNRVSASMATTVTTAYPSPHLLLQAYEKAESEEERRRLLADLTVRGGAKERRVGPELSNRLYRFMTSQNSQLVLD